MLIHLRKVQATNKNR